MNAVGSGGAGLWLCLGVMLVSFAVVVLAAALAGRRGSRGSGSGA